MLGQFFDKRPPANEGDASRKAQHIEHSRIGRPILGKMTLEAAAMSETESEAGTWYYFTSGPNEVVIRATPARVQKWDGEAKEWVRTLWRPEAIFSGIEFDSITKQQALNLTSAL